MPAIRSISKPHRQPGLSLTILLVVVGIACSPPSNNDKVSRQSDPEPREEDVDRVGMKNCLFIILDAAAATHFGAWGYHRDTTPNIDALAAEGFIFVNAHSQAPSTLPSTWSFLTGQYPLRPPSNELTSESHRIRERDFSLPEAFKQAGFQTLGFSQNPYIREHWGYERGYDTFKSYSVLAFKIQIGRDVETSARLFTDVREAIAASEADESRWFCYVHYLRPHSPYIAPAPHGEMFLTDKDRPTSYAKEFRINRTALDRKPVTRDEHHYMANTYDGNLVYADHKVGELVDWLREEDALDDTLIIIAGDHGEAFAQHGIFGHGFNLFEEMVHVPLVFLPPKRANFQPGSSNTLVEMIDVYPTLVELFDLAVPYELDGQSLAPALRGEPISEKPVSYAQIFNGIFISVRIGDRKMICKVDWETLEFSRFSVFDLSKDPKEKSNLYTEDYPIDTFLDAARTYIARWPAVSTDKVESDIPEILKEELEALGYLQK